MISKVDLSYRRAGVDVDFVSSCLNEIDKTRSRTEEVIKSPHDFAGLFSLKELCKRFCDPVLVSSTNGIGTKLLVAIACEKYEGLGQDLVALCANDIVTKGAEPLFFLDYFATAHVPTVPFIKVLNSIVAACDEINCALIGGETAEIPSLYAHKRFDLAGFVVGVAEKNQLFGSHKVNDKDVLLGIASSGLHANGFSLVRKIMFDKLRHKPHDVLWQTERRVITVADELLTPTKLYVNALQWLKKKDIPIHAIAHITGGGLKENVARILPPSLMATLDLREMAMPPIFTYLMENGSVTQEEMSSTFNMGIGLVMALPHSHKAEALALLKDCGETAFPVGSISTYEGGLQCQVKL